jgi:hypothetical protein
MKNWESYKMSGYERSVLRVMQIITIVWYITNSEKRMSGFGLNARDAN